jgi:hypothetical protein
MPSMSGMPFLSEVREVEWSEAKLSEVNRSEVK